MSKQGEDPLVKVRVRGVLIILGVVCFVAGAEVIDSLFFGDRYHPDATFYYLLGGMLVTLVTGLSIEAVARRNGKNHDG